MAIKLLAALLVIVAAYIGWWAISAASFLWLPLVIICLVTAAGLFQSKSWSQYLWHVIALLVILSWAFSVVRIASTGWPYNTVLESVVSLVPGLLLVAVCACGSAIVAKHFQGSKNPP